MSTSMMEEVPALAPALVLVLVSALVRFAAARYAAAVVGLEAATSTCGHAPG